MWFDVTMPVVRFVWGSSGSGLSDHAWRTAERTGAAWVGNDAAAHISLLRATVAEELAFAMEQRGVPREEMRRRVDAALTEWDLRGVAGDDPVTLSTGQTRRVAVAQALLAAPGALVLDCPLDGFDADAVRTLRRVLAGVPGPVTVYDRVRTPLADDAAEELELRPDGTLVAARAPAAVVPEGGQAVLPEGAPEEGQGSSPVLEAREVTVRHGSFRLGPVSLAAHGGEVTHLAGPNGAGKTTLMLAVLGLLPHAGRVTAPVAGWAPTAMDRSFLRRTVVEELSVGTTRRAAEVALGWAGLGRWRDTHPLDVPASDRRLLAVTAAVVRGPGLLLVDEPTVGLDAAGHGRLAELLRGFASGGYHRALTAAGGRPLWVGHGGPGYGARPAVLWTCHDAAFAGAVSDRGVTLARPGGPGR